MQIYRVVLRVEVKDDDIIHARDTDALTDMKEGRRKDYLNQFVEDELHWAAQSFSALLVEKVKLIKTVPDEDFGY